MNAAMPRLPLLIEDASRPASEEVSGQFDKLSKKLSCCNFAMILSILNAVIFLFSRRVFSCG